VDVHQRSNGANSKNHQLPNAVKTSIHPSKSLVGELVSHIPAKTTVAKNIMSIASHYVLLLLGSDSKLTTPRISKFVSLV